MKRKELGDVVNRGLNQTLTHYQDNEFAWKFVQTEVGYSLFKLLLLINRFHVLCSSNAVV